MLNDLCGNLNCIHNDKSCNCLIKKGLNYKNIEEVENTGIKELIDEAYGYSKKCFVPEKE